MSFPANREALIAAGYEPPLFGGQDRCRGCGAPIEWWRAPARRSMPLDAATLQPHWGTCPRADEFRRRKAQAGAR